MGNIVNRVFDSAGPEGKVRGTPQQIIEKYSLLARDAQLGGDRVAAENFQQHAEHYTRMLDEAQREQAQRQAEQQQRQQSQQGGRPENGADQPAGDVSDASPKGIETVNTGDNSNLVDLPENVGDTAERKPRRRKPRTTSADTPGVAADAPASDGGEETTAAE